MAPKDASTYMLMSKLNRRVNNLLISPRSKQNEQCFTRKERRVEVPSYTKRAGRCPGRDISAIRITSGSSQTGGSVERQRRWTSLSVSHILSS